MIIGIFLLGWLTSILFSYGITDNYAIGIQMPEVHIDDNFKLNTPKTEFVFSTKPKEKPSPQDWISEDQIHVTNKEIRIDLQNAEWARFTDTNSMDHVFDAGSNAIEIVPSHSAEIQEGDIVSYYSPAAGATIVHRVVETGYDDQGWYAFFKGDNINSRDPEKVRFKQIRRIVVAIIY